MNILNVGYDSTNYYLIGEPPARLMIDTGWPGTEPKLLHRLKRKGVSLAEIGYLLVTHYHPDHAGLAQVLKNRGVRLVVVEGQRDFIPLLRRSMKPSQHYVEIELGGNIDLRLKDSRSFLHRLGIEGEIISTPGHSDDSVTLIVDGGLAFTGDLRFPGAGSDNAADQVEQSWQRIRGFGVTTIYPGHGPVGTMGG
jgi:endoribonuclease LACTB2